MRNLINLFFLFIATSLLFSQRLDLKFEHLSIENGLSSNIINDICKGARGFVWIATEDGINRYDGYSFKVYRNVETDSLSLNSNKVYTFYSDPSGEFLVGTAEGLNRYNAHFDQFESVFKGKSVNKIVRFDSASYLIATSDGLLKVNNDFQIVGLVPNTLSQLSRDLIKDSKGRIWIVNDHAGVSLLTEGTDQLMHYTPSNSKIPGQVCTRVYETKKGVLLVATYDQGLLYYNETFDQFLRLPVTNRDLDNVPQKVFAVYEDEDENLWVGTDGDGLAIYDGSLKKYFTYTNSLIGSREISDNVVKAIFSDNRGGFWVGTSHRGINFVNKFSNNFKHREYIASYENINIVSAFLKDDKANLWLATDGGGIVFYDIQNRRTQFFEVDKGNNNSLPSNNVMDLEQDAEGNIWVATYYGGLSVYDTKGHVFKNYQFDENDTTSIPSNIIWDVFRDSKQRMWLCTLDGLALYDKANDQFIRFNKGNFNFPTNYIRSMLEVGEDRYLLASSKGMIDFSLQSDNPIVYKHEKGNDSSLGEDFVLNITKDKLGRIWVGTYGGGFYSFDEETKVFKGWTVNEGLSNNYICGIVSDKFNTLWITTQCGLSNFDPENEEFKNFYYQDGIQNDMFSINSIAKWSDDKILIGGINGYNSFIPESINKNTYPPKIQFTDFKLYGESVDVTQKKSVLDKHISLLDNIELNHEQNMISIHFAALNYIQSEDNLVSYYMENLDKGWSKPVHTDQVTYTNMSPGEYVFHLKASNNHGVWNKKEKTINIVIYPPFWQTRWFIGLCMITIIVCIYGFITWRLKAANEQKALLEQKVDEATDEITQKNTLLEDKEERMRQSLRYAKLIQDAVLPSKHEVEADLKEMFVLHRPFEIVSGDFYWYHKLGTKLVISVIDCTGHGVPGAFMSMMGNVLLNKIIQHDKITSPAAILEELNKEVQVALHQEETHNADGMDMSIVVIDTAAKKMLYAGAMNPLVYFQDEKVGYIRGTRRGIGGVDHIKVKNFEEHEIDLFTETTFYLFSDGYQDQFGTNGKKFMSKRFKQLLGEIHLKPLAEQQLLLENAQDEWRNGTEIDQTDDVLVIGCRV